MSFKKNNLSIKSIEMGTLEFKAFERKTMVLINDIPKYAFFQQCS